MTTPSPEAIEAVAAEICDWDNQYAWKSLGAESPMKASYEDAAVRAITAAAPLIAAQAKAEALASLTTEGLAETRVGLAMANAAWQEGASAMLAACNAHEPGAVWTKPVSPYSVPLLHIINLEGTDS